MGAFEQEVTLLYLDYHLAEDAFGFFSIRAPTPTQQRQRAPSRNYHHYNTRTIIPF